MAPQAIGSGVLLLLPELRVDGNVFWRACYHDFATTVARLRAHVDHPIGCGDHFQIVFDDEHRVARFNEPLHNVQ